MSNCLLSTNIIKKSSYYQFFTQDYTEITDVTISGLENAYWYKKNNGDFQRIGGRIYYINTDIIEGYGNKFYVYDTGFNSSNTYTWATTTTSIPSVQDITDADALGHGKTNTATITALNYGGTAWTYISGLNSSVYQGCNDWFIGSRIEYDMLRKSSTPGANYFAKTGGSYIWSSVEFSVYTSSSWCWGYDYQIWDYYSKRYSFCVLPLRAF